MIIITFNFVVWDDQCLILTYPDVREGPKGLQIFENSQKLPFKNFDIDDNKDVIIDWHSNIITSVGSKLYKFFKENPKEKDYFQDIGVLCVESDDIIDAYHGNLIYKWYRDRTQFLEDTGYEDTSTMYYMPLAETDEETEHFEDKISEVYEYLSTGRDEDSND